ncbi:MAG: phosphatase PAP2 family protein [Promethearchaeota archaeon]
MIDPIYFEYAGFILEFFAIYLLYTFGLHLLINAKKKENEVAKQYDLGLALFFISIATSALIYTIDLFHREFIGGRIFPAEAEYKAMGYIFDSMHPQFYFIILLTFISLSLYFLMKPIEKYLMPYKKQIISYICLIEVPLPAIIRIIELQFLPLKGTPLYMVTTGLFIMIWLLIGISVLSLIGIYIKLSIKSTGDIKKKSIAILFGIILWLLITFERSNFLKQIKSLPWTFWILSTLEIAMLSLLVYGFSESNLNRDENKEKTFLYQNWFFKTFMVGLFGVVAFYFSSVFWVNDLQLVGDLSTFANNNPAWKEFADFCDRSLFEGDAFGLQDIAYIFVVLALLLYILSFIPSLEPKLEKTRKYTGFFLAASVTIIIASRGFKAFFGRVRPGAALSDPSLYTGQWCIGKYDLSDAFSHGSFISGHTALASIVIILGFLAIGTHKLWKILLAFGLTLAYTITMAVGRVMEGAHYPSDTLWSILVSIVIIEYLYFYVFKIPEQEAGTYRPSSKAAEFSFIFLVTFFEIGLLAIALGLKYSILEFKSYWPGVSVVGLILCWLFLKLIKKTLKNDITS